MPSDDEEADDDRPDHGGMTSDDLGSVAGLTLNVAWLFVGLLALATLVALVTRRTRLPWSIGLLIAGLAIGVVIPGVEVAITPELLLAILLPGLVFEAALRIDARELRGTIVAVSVLAGPGVLISALVVALALHWFTGIALDSAFLVGAIVASTTISSSCRSRSSPHTARTSSPCSSTSRGSSRRSWPASSSAPSGGDTGCHRGPEVPSTRSGSSSPTS
jgi:hypothetical protein